MALSGNTTLLSDDEPLIHDDRDDEKMWTVNNFVNDFITKVRNGKQNSKQEIVSGAHCLIFIHGFKNDVADIFPRCEDIDEALGTKEIALTGFNWRSQNKVLKYKQDQAEATRMAPSFVKFIRLIKRTGEFKKIHIVAHSMGNHLLCEAILSPGAATVFSDCDVVDLAADVTKQRSR